VELMRAAAALLLWALPARAALPVSDVHVAVSSAAVAGLSCRRRPFSLEYSGVVADAYRFLAANSFASDPDPRTLAVGIFSMVLMIPMAVLALPADLLAAPLRRECSFEFRARGTLVRWAGGPVPFSPVALEARNLLSADDGGRTRPRYFVAASSAASNEGGEFALSVDGRCGRSSDLELAWKVRGLPSGTLRLSRRGSRFVLIEEEPEFGSSFETMEPIEILPERAPPRS
jgi:hypothetical protein